MVHTFCVVYRVCGVHYHYRCEAKSKAEARRLCCVNMGIKNKDIVSVELEY